MSRDQDSLGRGENADNPVNPEDTLSPSGGRPGSFLRRMVSILRRLIRGKPPGKPGEDVDAPVSREDAISPSEGRLGSFLRQIFKRSSSEAPPSSHSSYPNNGPGSSFKSILSILRELVRGKAPGEPKESNGIPTPGDLQEVLPRTEAEFRIGPPSSRWPLPGEMLGPFEIQQETGRGGFGVVYRALDTRLRRIVALKIPRPDRVQNEALWRSLAKEARLAANLRHPSIVGVHDAGVVEDTFYIASEYEECETLASYIARHPEGIPSRRAAELASALAEGLAHAHESGILHRDLTPNNVLVVQPTGTRAGESADGTPPANDQGSSRQNSSLDWPIRVRITDFGLGAVLKEPKEGGTQSGFLQGTPPYMAPEMLIASNTRIDQRVDIYGLGCILYELLTGQPIYKVGSIPDLCAILGRKTPPRPPRKIRRDVSKDLETICMACLEYEASRRYSSVALVREDLRRVSEYRAISRRALPPWERTARWVRRHPTSAALVATFLISVGVVTGLIVKHNLELERANGELTKTVADLRESRLAEKWARYDSDMRLASEDINSGRLEAAQDRLNEHRPRRGEPDQREFAWHLLWEQATRDYVVTPLYDLSWWKTGKPGDPLKGIALEDVQGLLNSDVQITPMAMTGVNTQLVSLRFDGRLEKAEVNPAKYGPRQPMRYFASNGQVFAPVSRETLPPQLSPDGMNLTRFDGVTRTPVRDNLTFVRSDGKNVAVWNVPWFDPSPRYSGNGRVMGVRIWTQETSYPTVFDLETRKLIRHDRSNPTSNREGPGESPGSPRTVLALSSDGRLAAWSSIEPRIEVFDSWTGKSVWKLSELEFGSTHPTSIAFSPDDSMLIIGDPTGRVTARSVSTGVAVHGPDCLLKAG